MSGIRQAAVLLIAITTVTAYFGAGGLGTSIFAGIRLNNSAQIVSAAVVISTLAVATNSLLYAAQRLLSGKDVYGSLSRRGVVGG
jgi:osmoprotectant transport system permease protein